LEIKTQETIIPTLLLIRREESPFFLTLMKQIYLTFITLFSIQLAYSQAFVQGGSIMYGRGREKEDSLNPTFSATNFNYFAKLKLTKRFYLKSNLGIARYVSKTEVYPQLTVINNQLNNFETLTYDAFSKATFTPLTLGVGIDLKLKNLAIGFNLQQGFGFRRSNFERWKSKVERETFTNSSGITDNKYNVLIYNNPKNIYANAFSYSIDIEYSFKRMGIKYSYLVASDKPISQFGITYSLKYDWKTVSE